MQIQTIAIDDSIEAVDVASVFYPLRHQINDDNPPRSRSLSFLTASPPSSILFGVRSTMTTHHDRGVSRYSRRRLCLLSSSPS
ncbi:hypothetical protein F2Q69_00016986 [Brassica cretica]|uniref:Uncharacterized protein n=1 Tax=Brassica cretica TaxID=69181 RepID=A0A8S9R6X9_BRACR|nr:hypothetical protein F2Q69_00016986 [Brassica cretica]